MRDFNFFYGEARARSARAAAAVRRRQEERPFETREEIHEAFEAELAIQERCIVTDADRAFLGSLHISEPETQNG